MKNTLKPKTAIVHDALLEDGGSELVFRKLSEMFPHADLYTSLINKEIFTYKKLKKRIIKSYLISGFAKFNPSFLKPLINIYWQDLDLSSYDLVISSSGSFSAKSIITKPGTVHISYCHTPPKYLYGEYAETDSRNSPLNNIKNLLYFFIRQGDYISAQRPDVLIANSATVSARIKKYYRRDSVIIYPPVAIPEKLPDRGKAGDYYIFIGRLYKQKGPGLLVDTFNKSGKKLIVIGIGKELNYLKSKASANIIFKGYTGESEKNKLLSGAKALIFPSIDEDFGIVPVEAMAMGVPVVAYYSGGVRETVIDAKTGVFFREFSEPSLSAALTKFEKSSINPSDCYRQAGKFSVNRFEKKFLEITASLLSK